MTRIPSKIVQQNLEILYNRIKWLVEHRKHKTRPLEIKILHLAKGTKLTYDQVRNGIYKLEKEGRIERFKKYELKNTRTFYRLPLPRTTNEFQTCAPVSHHSDTDLGGKK